MFTYISLSLNEASFLPKLQDHFAEFLKLYYFIRFCILYLTTWVGYKYGFIMFIVFSRIQNFLFFKNIKKTKNINIVTKFNKFNK